MQIKKSINNIFFGFISQIITIALGIIIPKLFITNFGSEMNGLISSVDQIFVYIGLFEAGVGTATLIALYGPVAKNKKNQISAILAATNIYNRKTGIFYFVAVLVFATIYPFVVISGINKVTVIVIILFSGITGTANFFFQGKFSLLLQAEGKNYIITNLNIIITILTSITKIILLINGFEVIVVQAVFVLFNSIQIVYIYYYIRKNYQWLNLKTTPNYKPLAKKNSVLIHQISALIFFNTDIIILTIFTNLKVVSVYSLYMLLFGMIGTAINTLASGFNFNLGQTFNTDKVKFRKMIDAFEMFFLAVVFALYSIGYVFYFTVSKTLY